tara:strand:+ start:8821 stop:9171 length:351 start_codon:yes stop_codon:yes gene_type:complete
MENAATVPETGTKKEKLIGDVVEKLVECLNEMITKDGIDMEVIFYATTNFAANALAVYDVGSFKGADNEEKVEMMAYQHRAFGAGEQLTQTFLKCIEMKLKNENKEEKLHVIEPFH